MFSTNFVTPIVSSDTVVIASLSTMTDISTNFSTKGGRPNITECFWQKFARVKMQGKKNVLVTTFGATFFRAGSDLGILFGFLGNVVITSRIKETKLTYEPMTLISAVRLRISKPSRSAVQPNQPIILLL